jgi:hypothetical protein
MSPELAAAPDVRVLVKYPHTVLAISPELGILILSSEVKVLALYSQTV